MRKGLRVAAAGMLGFAVATWLVTGANRGWTKTTVSVRTLDPVTGIEGITDQPRFLPGVDFLGVSLLGTGLLAGASFLFRPNHHQA